MTASLDQQQQLDAKQPRFARQRRTRTMREGGVERLLASKIIVAGAGALGSPFVNLASQAGATVVECDFDVFEETQQGVVGELKAPALAAHCNARGSGRVTGLPIDIRHLGIGEFASADLIVDCTDDSRLEMPLSTISNGLGIPKLRLAVDGTGERELGRVACSHGAVASCGVCSYNAGDLVRQLPRMSCPGRQVTPTATVASGALASVVAGIGALQAQRLISRNDLELVLDREILIDLDQSQLIPLTRDRCNQCLTGHVRWNLVRLNSSARATTLADVYAASYRELLTTPIILEAYAHSLHTLAYCSCGTTRQVVGTRWASPPTCSACGRDMTWVAESQRHRLTAKDLADLEIAERTLADLGLPARGAMIVARADGCSPLRWVLD